MDGRKKVSVELTLREVSTLVESLEFEKSWCDSDPENHQYGVFSPDKEDLLEAPQSRDR